MHASFLGPVESRDVAADFAVRLRTREAEDLDVIKSLEKEQLLPIIGG